MAGSCTSLSGNQKVKTGFPRHLASRLVVLALMLCCGIGLWWAARKVPGVNTTSRSALAGSTNPTTISGQVNGDVTEEQLAASVAAGSGKNRKQPARSLFATLGSSELKRLAQRIEKVSTKIEEEEGWEENSGWILASEFYRRWGEVAPKEALAFLGEHESYWAGLRETVYTSWARTDPDAAAAAYDPALERQYSSELKEALLEGLSSADPEKALRFADSQRWCHATLFTPEHDSEAHARYSTAWELLAYVPVEAPSDPFGLAMHSWIQRDPEAAFGAMLSLKYDLLKQATLAALFSNWLLRDPDAALAASSRIEDRSLCEMTIHTAMEAYLLRQPQEALYRILAISPFEDEATDSGNRPLPFRFCDTMPTRTSDRMGLVSEAAAAMGVRDGRKAWDIAAMIEDDNARAAALGGALAGWLILDTDGAAAFAREGIRHGSFDVPGGADFPAYAARIVAKMLAQRDFEKAKAWAEALPSGPLQDGAIKTAVQARLQRGWDVALAEGEGQPDRSLRVQLREYAPVADWVASLPASKGRDEAAFWLVFRMREHDDPRPALKFAALIEGGRLRQLSFEDVAEELLGRKGKAKPEFDLAAWSAANPGPASEPQREMDRKRRPPAANAEQAAPPDGR